MKVGSADKVYYYYIVFPNTGVYQNWKMNFTTLKIVTEMTRYD